MKKLFTVILIFLTFNSFADKPAWVLFEDGKKEFHNNELGKSFKIFRTCLDKKSIFPEADYWIGLIYEKEGEYQLALQQFQKALNNKSALLTRDDYIKIHYSIAGIYETKRMYNKFEQELITITNQNKSFADHEQLKYKSSVIKTFETRGINNALELYRINVNNAYDAHRQMGIFYYRTGQYYNALMHLSYAALSASSSIIRHFQKKDPDYKFTTFNEILKLAEKDKQTKRFLVESKVYQVYYYLAAALYARGHSIQARDIWWEILKFNETGIWGSKSHLQYQKPYIEPLLDINPPY